MTEGSGRVETPRHRSHDHGRITAREAVAHAVDDVDTARRRCGGVQQCRFAGGDEPVGESALDVDAATTLLDQVRAKFDPATAFTAAFSAVMVGHTGPGLVGLSWWWQPSVGASPSSGP